MMRFLRYQQQRQDSAFRSVLICTKPVCISLNLMHQQIYNPEGFSCLEDQLCKFTLRHAILLMA